MTIKKNIAELASVLLGNGEIGSGRRLRAKDNRMDDWKFDTPKNTAVIADIFFIEKQEPCLHVVHDEADGGWQFLTANTNRDMSRATAVALSTAISVDESLNELFDLPLGWMASRSTNQSRWQRRPMETTSDHTNEDESEIA